MAGRPYTEDGLALELRKLVAKLHGAGRLDSHRYDLHGLRHTRGVELALAGCSDAEGAAMMGHGGRSSFMQYRRQADRVRLSDTASARVAKLREQAGYEECKNGAPKMCKSRRSERKRAGINLSPFNLLRWYRPSGSNGGPLDPQSSALTN